MTQTSNTKNFYCSSEQLKQLKVFKNQVSMINKNYSKEIIEFLYINDKTSYTKYMYSNIKYIEDKLMNESKVKFIDYISTKVNYKNGNYSPSFLIFDKLNSLSMKIDSGVLNYEIIENNENLKKKNKRKEGWGIITIECDKSDETPSYFLKEFEELEFNITAKEIQTFFSLREQFNLSDWIELILYSLGYSSDKLTFKEKFTILARAIPFCEKNFSLLEIGSRGTGKSEFYKLFGNESVKSYNEPPSVPALFYNNNTNEPGYIATKDVLIIDEVHKMKFDDKLTPMFKSYLANGIFDRGKETSSECSVVFLGNYDNLEKAYNNPEQIVANLKNEFFKDTAIIERISFISYGWEVQKYKNPIDNTRDKILPSYLIKILQYLKNENYSYLIENKVEFHEDLSERDKKNIIKTVSGLLKLLHPNKEVRDKELIAYLTLAIENEEYKVNLKKYIENPTQSTISNNSEFKLPVTIFTPKNDNYKNNIHSIKKEFILYNYIDLFKSNYSLKDFIPIAKEFELDNSSDTGINFFPVSERKSKNKETKIIGDTFIVEHPNYDREMLNIAISLTGIKENKKKNEIYDQISKNFPTDIYNFEEKGQSSNNFVLLSSKKREDNTNSMNFDDNEIFPSLKLNGRSNKIQFNNTFCSSDIIKIIYENRTITPKTNIFMLNLIPYYPKSFYKSKNFKIETIFNNYSYFRSFDKIPNKIKINYINYKVSQEIYEVSYKYNSYQSQPEEKINNFDIDNLIIFLKENY